MWMLNLGEFDRDGNEFLGDDLNGNNLAEVKRMGNGKTPKCQFPTQKAVPSMENLASSSNPCSNG
ncbi:MAG TPA: hypothetical protein VFO70_08315 [Chitinophagaceae bacterium]|nr:hypothetical protein [Chitinophagaceae bacterium]